MAPTSAPRRGRALAACACAALVFALAAVGPAAACGKPSYGSAAMADMDSYGDDASASMAMEKNCTTVPEVLQSAALNTTGPELLNASMPLVIDVLKYHVSPDMLDESALAEISTLLPGETLMADEQMVEAACSN